MSRVLKTIRRRESPFKRGFHARMNLAEKKSVRGNPYPDGSGGQCDYDAGWASAGKLLAAAKERHADPR